MGDDRTRAPFDDEISAHRPVLLKEVINGLQPSPGRGYIDATLGGGGYALAILERIRPGGLLIGIDRDRSSIDSFPVDRAPGDATLLLRHANFAELPEVAKSAGRPVDGVIFDLGLSSIQLDDPERGFSFRRDGPLDMRYDRSEPWTAADLLNREPASEIRRIISEYGEERWAARIAERIVSRRKERPYRSTSELVETVAGAIPRRAWPRDIHVATRTFQALRMAVNRELESLERGLKAAIELLASGGRIGVVSFHSLEDRLAKNLFHVEATDCICPPQSPVCTCSHRRSLCLITRKPIRPSEAEVASNPRSRSARLRIAEKL